MRHLAPLLVALGLACSPAPPTGPMPSGVDLAHAATIDVLEVGQGDAILIRSPEGKTALVDAGPSKDIVPLLRERGVTSIDLAVVTHHHADHYGGMDDVIRAFRPQVFLAPGSSHTSPAYLKLLTLVRDSGITSVFPTDAPREIELGSVGLTVLPQPPEDETDENDNSIGLRVRHGSFIMLLTGDSEGKERAFWEATCPELIRDCTVLKLAHHGSRNGTDARWLGIVRPRLAVASLGAGNEYNHPHAQTLALLRERDIPLLRTDLDGTIELVSDGERWGVVGGVPARGPVTQDEGGDVARRHEGRAGASRHRGRLIEINRASREELETIPGVGPATARHIIQGRPYRTVEDLLSVEGIGERRMAEIRPYVTAR